LSDGNREIKQAADNALADFLKEIKEAEVLEFGPMVTILVNQCRSKEKANRYALLWPVWVCAVVHRHKRRECEYSCIC
jgi:vacuole morphology and inheritance protein 14